MTNYTLSNHLSSEGNSEYVAAQNRMNADMMTWGKINDLMVEMKFNPSLNNEQTLERIQYMLLGCTDTTFVDAVDWALDQEGEDGRIVSPFENEEFVAGYFTDAVAELEEADEVLEQGKEDNANGDSFNLVTVIYTVVLFLLGIVGTFKNLPNREIVLIISVVGFLVASIYMLTLPMPTGFSLASFF